MDFETDSSETGTETNPPAFNAAQSRRQRRLSTASEGVVFETMESLLDKYERADRETSLYSCTCRPGDFLHKECFHRPDNNQVGPALASPTASIKFAQLNTLEGGAWVACGSAHHVCQSL